MKKIRLHIQQRRRILYLEQKNYYDAKDAFLQAAKIEPDLASRHINLGIALMGLKDYFKANISKSEYQMKNIR